MFDIIKNIFRNDTDDASDEEIEVSRMVASRNRKKAGAKGSTRGSMSGAKSATNIKGKKASKTKIKGTKVKFVSSLRKNNGPSRKRAASPIDSDSSDDSSFNTSQLQLNSILNRKQFDDNDCGAYGGVVKCNNARNVHWGNTPVYHESARRLYGIPFHKNKKRRQGPKKQYSAGSVPRIYKTRTYNEWMKIYNHEKDEETRRNTVFNTCYLSISGKKLLSSSDPCINYNKGENNTHFRSCHSSQLLNDRQDQSTNLPRSKRQKISKNQKRINRIPSKSKKGKRY